MYRVHRDSLYRSTWELPEIISELTSTTVAARARRISQSVLPEYLIAMGAVPSRWLHGLGVAFLLKLALEENGQSFTPHERELLSAAAVLHDCGNPPFTHLSEPFLQQVFAKDGESFLEEIIDRFSDNPPESARKVLYNRGIDVPNLVDTIRGLTPKSTILNGVLDLDNADNVYRYAYSMGLLSDNSDSKLRSYRTPMVLARKFCWSHEQSSWSLGDRWSDDYSSEEAVYYWQTLRSNLYRAYVYGSTHRSLTAMLGRVLELAFAEDYLNPGFFFMDDYQAMNYLGGLPNRPIRGLMYRLEHYQIYSEVFRYEIEEANSLIEQHATYPALAEITRKACARLKLEPEDLVVEIFQSKENRSVVMPGVDLPLLPNPWYVIAYLPQGKEHKTQAVTGYLRQELGLV